MSLKAWIVVGVVAVALSVAGIAWKTGAVRSRTGADPGPHSGAVASLEPAGARTAPPGAATSTCDTLAGHPEDPARTAPGVADEDILPEEAITQCLRALEETPEAARLHFQLARAYWADMEYEDAVESLLRAEALGYSPAYYYLGLAFEQGLVESEPLDPEAARDMYLIAASDGFAPAVRARSENQP